MEAKLLGVCISLFIRPFLFLSFPLLACFFIHSPHVFFRSLLFLNSFYIGLVLCQLSLSPIYSLQAESLRYKLLGGLAVRRACYGVLRFIMENGAKGCEVIVSGKLRGQRAKAMKFQEGFMKKSGSARNDYVDTAVRHVLMRQGVLGVKVAIMLPHDPEGKMGPAYQLPDVVQIHEPKEEETLPAAE